MEVNKRHDARKVGKDKVQMPPGKRGQWRMKRRRSS